MSVYEYLDYRKMLAEKALERKKTQNGWTLLRLAERAGLHAPFLTNVLKGRAHLNGDQLYSVLKTLDCGSDEITYGLLLLEWERSDLPERRQLLKERIEGSRQERLKTTRHIEAKAVDASPEEATRYYINPELQLVHAFLGVEKYARDPRRIAESLNIDPGRIEGLIEELVQLGYAKRGSAGLEKNRRVQHLPKESPLCAPQQMLLRYRSLQHQQLLSESSRYNFAVIFTGDETVREKIQLEFLKFLKEAEKLVKAAPSEGVYQMHFDLFPWSR